MPYVYHEDEEMQEGWEGVDVVERSDYDTVITERDELRVQRDGLIERAEAAEQDAANMREKYANRFMTTPSIAKREQEEDVKRDGRPKSYEELFTQREGI